MKIDALTVPCQHASYSDLSRCCAVVVDVLRATTTIAAALESGVKGVIPVQEVEMAFQMRESRRSERVLLGGERGSVLIEGFNLSNSPEEYTPDRVGGTTVVLTTTNGTQAIERVRHARHLLAGSLLNAGAVARWITETGCAEVLLVCAGTHGRLALEDVIGAGAIIDRLGEYGIPMESSDGARMVVTAWREAQHDLERAVRQSDHGRTLLALGHASDITYCSSLDRSGVVPLLTAEGFIDAREMTGN